MRGIRRIANMARAYSVIVTPVMIPQTGRELFRATVPAFPQIEQLGDTPEHAERLARIVIEAWLEHAAETGGIVSAPDLTTITMMLH